MISRRTRPRRPTKLDVDASLHAALSQKCSIVLHVSCTPAEKEMFDALTELFRERLGHTTSLSNIVRGTLLLLVQSTEHLAHELKDVPALKHPRHGDGEARLRFERALAEIASHGVARSLARRRRSSRPSP